ncbi:MAG: LysM peptidoglycan-binding domain-containing protein [Pseudomonadota bacterium]|nr:LysM peptidoglycan-binding domain-containing protein [Pseudomonadota bacterium]
MPSPLPLLLLRGLLSTALAQEPALDAEAPAVEPGESIWTFIESADGTPATADVRAATQELVEERIAELGNVGSVGAEPPLEFYLDPFGATSLDPLHLDKLDPSEFDIPVIVNADVKKWMEYFLGRGRKYYARYLERSTQWLPMMHREMDARGLPRDLAYLSMIESGFSTGATSYAAAAGLWQFMTYTGKDYGLRIDWWVDDRRDPEKATDAALRYLSDLNKMFSGDWWLSWASYNGGQGRVLKATRAAGTTDFWKITTGEFLHTETENYVPKLIAAAIIGKHPERYGFVGLKYLPEWKFETVEVPASTSVAVMAKCAGMTEDAFLVLNPALRRYALPPDPAMQKVRIAPNRTASFKENFAKVPPDERLTLQRHVVRRGESLGSIARKYGLSVEELARVNRIGNINQISVGMELVVPSNGKALASTEEVKPTTTAATPTKSTSSSGASSGSAPAAPATVTKTVPAVTHTVKSGDTLSGLASKYGVTAKQIQGWNKMSGTGIQIGQKLVVKAASTTTVAAPAKSSSTAKAEVKPSSGASKATTYTVRRGDTLSTIADRYNCSVSDLKSWNGLKGSTIYPGQKLKIKG